MERAGDTIKSIAEEHGLKTAKTIEHTDAGAYSLTKRQTKRMECFELARQGREDGQQDIGFSSRPFISCGLPVRRSKENPYIRRNGPFKLEITGSREFGLPFGQDRLVVIWLATEAIRNGGRLIHFRSAAEVLDAFNLPKDGFHYKRLVQAFQRIATAQISFSSNGGKSTHLVWDFERVTFVDKARIWYARDVHQQTLAGDFQNMIYLSESFWEEVNQHRIPIELAVAGGLSDSPAVLDLYCWIVWRTNGIKKPTAITLESLQEQLGVSDKTKLKQFRYQLRRSLDIVGQIWPECPAAITADGSKLMLKHGKAIRDAQR